MHFFPSETCLLIEGFCAQNSSPGFCFKFLDLISTA
uniref:Uncharacterized protein n=1 Tax=Arundo donax TaxID=35708 RepID=A0A0A8ZPI6_ARUDO